MNLNCSAGRHRKGQPYRDLRDHCENLNVKAQTDEEATWLAAFYRVVTFGGEIHFKPLEEEAVEVEFYGLRSERNAAKSMAHPVEAPTDGQ